MYLTHAMGKVITEDNSQLIPLRALCEQLGPVNWIPLLLSLASPFSFVRLRYLI